MNKRDLLLEIGLEEIPARFIPGAIEALEKRMSNWLQGRKDCIWQGAGLFYATKACGPR